MTPEQSALFAALTPLQKEIVTNVLSGMKPIDAYRASSGKAKESAITAVVTRLLADASVKAFLDSMRSERVDKAIMSRDEALKRLTAIARTSMSEMVAFGDFKVVHPITGTETTQTTWEVIPSALQDPEKLAAIAELTATKEGPKIKLHSPLVAIKQIAEMQGWLAPAESNVKSDNVLIIKGGLPDD